jgi:hypothetical protein
MNCLLTPKNTCQPGCPGLSSATENCGSAKTLNAVSPRLMPLPAPRPSGTLKSAFSML